MKDPFLKTQVKNCSSSLAFFGEIRFRCQVLKLELLFGTSITFLGQAFHVPWSIDFTLLNTIDSLHVDPGGMFRCGDQQTLT